VGLRSIVIRGVARCTSPFGLGAHRVLRG
jgi:hypothetical protein